MFKTWPLVLHTFKDLWSNSHFQGCYSPTLTVFFTSKIFGILENRNCLATLTVG